MKKLLLLFALVAFAACNTEDEEKNRLTITYKGTSIVTNNQAPEAAPFVHEDAKFELATVGDGRYKLTMLGVRFAATMPALNIIIPELKIEDPDGDGIFSLWSTVDPIVPYIGELEHPEFGILDFAGTLGGDEIMVTFVCKNEQMRLNHTVVYTGTAQ